MPYLREPAGTLIVPADYKQIFKNEFAINVGKNEIVKMRLAQSLTDRDIDIAKFLFSFTFATAKQISRYVSLQKGEDVNSTTTRLDRLVQHRVLNKFILKRFVDGNMPADALTFYCLDLGGRYLLSNFSNVDTTDWYSIVNMKSSELISQSITTTEFYLRLRENVGNRLLHFEPAPELRVGRKNVIPSFEFSMKANGMVNHFIGEIVREYDFPVNFRERAEKIEELLLTNAWRKYYFESDQEPILFVIGDTDETASRAGKFISQATELNRVRYTTDERMQRELGDAGAFMQYVNKDQVLQEVKTTIFYK